MAHNGKFCQESCLLQSENIGKVVNQAELATPSTSVGKDWKSCESGEISHSESF